MAAVDEPSAQLYVDVRDSVRDALATRRPLLHHLNDDSSWFLQLPRPSRAGGRFYYNILIDPWLSGGQSDVASWFSQQFHASDSAVKSISALEELAREIELLASGLQTNEDRGEQNGNAMYDGDDQHSLIDAVAVSHEFTDHCHKDTLLEIHPDVPVFAIKEAAHVIQRWRHFRTIVIVDAFGKEGNSDWRSGSTPPLPEWIAISRLLQTDDVLNYHSALMIAFNIRHGAPARQAEMVSSPAKGKTLHRHKSIKPNEDEDSAEAIVYTPHGIHSGDLNLIPNASPQVRTLAFLHGLHNIRVGTVSGRTALQSNLGARNGLKAQRMLNAKYWVGTHDEIKVGGGLISWFLQREVISLEDALDEERQAKDGQKDVTGDGLLDSGTLDAFEGINWLDIANGESRVLM